ncbi:hypothetical protein KGQ64_01880 [bacterium]|nr:hypothetical protein [bacterium]
MAEGDASGPGKERRPESEPGPTPPAGEPVHDRSREAGDAGADLVRPSWDHAKDYPEPLADARTSTAVAIGLVAAALLGGGLWLAMRTPEGERPRPSAAAPTAAPEARVDAAPTAAPTWAPLGDGAGIAAHGPAATVAPVAAATPAAAARPDSAGAGGTGTRPGIDRPRRPRPTPSDPRRAEWRQRVERLRDERRSILRDRSLTREQKRDRMEDLLREQFRSRNPVPPPPPNLVR